jgi:hypothetical protein
VAQALSECALDYRKFYAVNVTYLEDVDIAELVGAPITYVDGRNDNFQ